MKILSKTSMRVLNSIVVLGLLAVSFQGQSFDGQLVRQLSQGTVKGVHQGNSIIFKGIPYAEPPIADHRWQPPLPPAKFVGEFSAEQYGPVCPQKSQKLTQSENCLTLNIFSPDSIDIEAQSLPVLVWIHGGGFVFGSGNMTAQGHKNWNDNEIILVSFNYRLGALGIFAPSDMTLPKGANFSVMDMVAALKWLKANISAFGGDPNRITIAGGSAGGMAVQMLMVNPQSQGLFQGAISQSGYGAWPLPRTKDAAELKSSPSAEELSDQIARRALNIEGEEIVSENLNELLFEVSAASLVAAIDGFHIPIVDGKTLPEEPAIMFVQGRQHSVPYISGGNSYEGSVYPYSGVEPTALFSLMGKHKERIKQLYKLDEVSTSAVPYQHLFGDLRYLLAAKLTSQSMDNIGQAGYRYFYNYVSDKQAFFNGAKHASETYKLFQADNVPVLNQMRQYWYNFIKQQNPNGPNLPKWPNLNENNQGWLEIADKINVRPEVRADKLAILESLFHQRRDEIKTGN
ncbi:carboxylesterase/lipase family protein [Aliiglaciecola aliphaticivorans]